MNLDKLKELDLSNGQIKVYEAVLELGIASLNGIQEKTGIERRNIYDILNKLIERGFVSYTLEKGKRTYQCTSPNKLSEEIKRKANALAELENQIPSLKEAFNISRPETRAEVFRGNESIKSLLKEVLEHKESSYEHKQLPAGMYIPMVIIIFGNKVAQITWGEQSFAFVLESNKIKQSYMKYFNYFWELENK